MKIIVSLWINADINWISLVWLHANFVQIKNILFSSVQDFISYPFVIWFLTVTLKESQLIPNKEDNLFVPKKKIILDLFSQKKQ